MNILAIESSCDETAAAVVRDGRTVLSNCIASQIEMHTIYGGVVPEIASRKHVEAITGLAEQAVAQAGLTKGELDAVAVTYAPGLIGAVLVGVNGASKTAACWPYTGHSRLSPEIRQYTFGRCSPGYPRPDPLWPGPAGCTTAANC